MKVFRFFLTSFVSLILLILSSTYCSALTYDEVGKLMFPDTGERYSIEIRNIVFTELSSLGYTTEFKNIAFQQCNSSASIGPTGSYDINVSVYLTNSDFTYKFTNNTDYIIGSNVAILNANLKFNSGNISFQGFSGSTTANQNMMVPVYHDLTTNNVNGIVQYDGVDLSKELTDDDILNYNFPLNEIHILKPKDGTTINAIRGDNKNFVLPIEVYGKFDSSFLTGSNLMYSIKDEISKSLVLTISGNGLSTTVKDYVRKYSSIDVVGTPDLNGENQIFKLHLTTSVYVPDDFVDTSIQIGFNVIKSTNSLGFPNSYAWMSDSSSFTFKVFTDNDKDGFDDNTGEQLPSNPDIDYSDTVSKPGEGASILDWLNYYFDCFINGINSIFNKIADVFTGISNTISNMVTTTEGIFGLFNNVFSFLPPEIRFIFYGGISVMILISIWHFMKG